MSTNLNMHSTPFVVPFNLIDDINSDPSSLSGSDTYTKKAVPPVPLCEKWLLSVPEAAAYFGIGQNRISELGLAGWLQVCCIRGQYKTHQAEEV